MSKRRHSKNTGVKLAPFRLSLDPALMQRLGEVGKELGLSRSALLSAGAEEILTNLENCPKCGKLIGWFGELVMAAPGPDDMTVVCLHCHEVIG